MSAVFWRGENRASMAGYDRCLTQPRQFLCAAQHRVSFYTLSPMSWAMGRFFDVVRYGFNTAQRKGLAMELPTDPLLRFVTIPRHV